MKVKISILTWIYFFIFPVIAICQLNNDNTVAFQYDEAGNRILMHTVYIPEIDNIDSDSKTSSVVQNIEEVTISDTEVYIYPNPIKQSLNIHISDLEDEKMINYQLYTIEGQLISKGKIYNNETQIQFNTFKPGAYFLKLIIDTDNYTWKVIKQ